MSRHICLALAAFLSLAGSHLAHGQDTPNTNPSASPTNSPAPATEDMATLQAENAALKKEVADAKQTIAQLQAQLAKDSSAPGTAAPIADATDAGPSTNAAPAGPQKALPLDATNPNVDAAAPGSPASGGGPSRSYTVVKGDSLWKIAHKMYPGDTKNGVDKIEEANKDAIGGKPLKIGQVLIIP
jgi:5'-nucleotidase